MDPGPAGSYKPLSADSEGAGRSPPAGRRLGPGGSGAVSPLAGAAPDGGDGAAAAKVAIRADMRRRRAGLGADAVAAAGAAASARLRALPVMRTARLVAAYRAVRGEIPLEELMDGPPSAPVAVRYTLPRVRGQDLEFALRRPGGRFEPGAFGIPEPVGGEVVVLADHDVVLVPLVAFDAEGRRVGNGKGFYDRALAGLAAGLPDPDPGAGARGRSEAADHPGPVLIGVAHSFQQVDEVPSHPWDVPLDAVVTEAGLVEVAPRP